MDSKVQKVWPSHYDRIEKLFIILMVKSAQADGFSKEISHLMKKKVINKKRNVIALNPFLDKDGVFRVGGRLDLSEIS